MPRRTRSPLAGVSRRDLIALRALAREAAAWKKFCAPGRHRWMVKPHDLLGQFGLRARISDYRAQDEFESRALNRLELRMNWTEIYRARQLGFIKKFDQRTYEVHMLRQEVAAVREEQERIAA